MATQARETMRGVMDNCNDMGPNNPGDTIKTVGDYLPYVITIVAQCLASAQPPAMKQYGITWSSLVDFVAKGDKAKWYYYASLSDEVMHSFMLYAIAHVQKAEDLVVLQYPDQAQESASTSLLVSPKNSDALTEATRALRVSAGIFQAILSIVLPQVGDLTPAGAPDIWPSVLEALQQMCLANAQEIGIVNALKTRKSFSVVAKLCAGVCDRYKGIRNKLRTDLGAKIDNLRLSIRTYMDIKIDLYNALKIKYIGVDQQEKGEYGVCVGLFQMAWEIVRTLMVAIEFQGNSGMNRLKEDLMEQKQAIKKLLDCAKSDNERIYFSLVPARNELEALLPDGVFFVKEEAFDPPSLTNLSFVDVDQDEVNKRCNVM